MKLTEALEQNIRDYISAALKLYEKQNNQFG